MIQSAPCQIDPVRGGSAARRELPGLTSLRGIAAVTVLFFHSSYIAYHYAGGASPAFWRRGYLAVDLFFFLSGFVLTHVYASRLSGEPSWPVIGKFIWARFCRIYPASLFTTAVFVLAFTVGKLSFPAGASFKEQLIAALLLLQVPWLDGIVINPPSWSISSEWYAYLLFPFVVPVICRLRGRTAALLGVALLIGIAVDHMIFTHEEQNRGWGALLRALPEFTVGAFTYRSYSERLFRTVWEKDATYVGVMAMLIAACLVGVSDGPVVVLLLALLVASVCNCGRIAGILNARPLRWLGDVSYSVYIFQAVPFMFAIALAPILVAHGLGGSIFLAIAVLFAFGGGVLVHRCVDLPVRAALRRLPDRVKAFAAVDQVAQIGPVPLRPAAPSYRHRRTREVRVFRGVALLRRRS
jgi:peptidoglycan/LPS O-acetylase OafA/YrhL